MSRTTLGGAIANAAAVLCVVVAYVKRDDLTIEGAYFNESVGASQEQLAVSAGSSPWLLAAGALVLVGTSALVWASHRPSTS